MVKGAPVVQVGGAYEGQQQLDLLPGDAGLEGAPDGPQRLVHHLLRALGHVLPRPVHVARACDERTVPHEVECPCTGHQRPVLCAIGLLVSQRSAHADAVSGSDDDLHCRLGVCQPLNDLRLVKGL